MHKKLQSMIFENISGRYYKFIIIKEISKPRRSIHRIQSTHNIPNLRKADYKRRRQIILINHLKEKLIKKSRILSELEKISVGKYEFQLPKIPQIRFFPYMHSITLGHLNMLLGPLDQDDRHYFWFWVLF